MIATVACILAAAAIVLSLIAMRSNRTHLSAHDRHLAALDRRANITTGRIDMIRADLPRSDRELVVNIAPPVWDEKISANISRDIDRFFRR